MKFSPINYAQLHEHDQIKKNNGKLWTKKFIWKTKSIPFISF